jgi:hypothetical protein
MTPLVGLSGSGGFLGAPGNLQLSMERASQLQEEVRTGALVTIDQAEIFIRTIVQPRTLQSRVVEDYRPDRRVMRRQVTLDVQLPSRIVSSVQAHSEPQMVLYPIMVPPKGVFLDQLTVHDAAGQILPTLSYQEYLKVAASVLHRLIATACDTQPVDLPPEAAQRELQAIWGIIKRIDGADEDSAVAREAARSLQTLRVVSSDPERRTAIRLAAELAEVLTTHYAIVVAIPLPQTGSFIVKYETTLIPTIDPAGKSWIRKLKAPISIPSSQVVLPILNAWTAQSYHVTVQYPDDYYLSKQQLIIPHEYLNQTARGAPAPPYVRFRRRLGQPYGHFYARFLPSPREVAERRVDKGEAVTTAEAPPRLLFQFREVPSLTFRNAWLAAIALAVLTWIIGYSISRFGTMTLSADIPALVLVAPGIAATWIGFGTTTHRLAGDTGAVYFFNVSTALISLCATGLYLLSGGYRISGTSRWLGISGANLLGIRSWPWAVLAGLAVLNVFYVSYLWWINSQWLRQLETRQREIEPKSGTDLEYAAEPLNSTLQTSEDWLAESVKLDDLIATYSSFLQDRPTSVSKLSSEEVREVFELMPSA